MTKTITFKQSDKAVFEVLKEIKASGWNRGGNLRTMLRIGAIDNITREQAVLLAKYADKGQEQYQQIFEALEKEVTIKLEEVAKELTLVEAMKAMNVDRKRVKIVGRMGEQEVHRFTDFEDLEEIGIRDIDDLDKAKFFTVVR
ncbi:hypothetical protein P4159_05985 [Bacillus thuringiensis]|uniref:hypothetical protein n=1 Tax=Bacillus cereus group TaxID=86661 RepID=UPI000CD7F1DF|nr:MULTISPECIES: hypothetical protein [Bacillus cereus group]MEC3420532.1 hypothetical protein [Bacillus cereus]MEC3596942.1 hypothetical protein [Bacillus thuringiensis]MED1574291.1 hypothetical protein [Bacillus paranthracis]MED1836215.1 hypothetical protein [Bacillus thuringiensis]MED2670278.1 hypothetical protein [Bacillus thuringiensis]